MNTSPKILLSFDVEEFDLPLEYNIAVDADEQMRIGKAGADEMKRLLDAENVPATLFTTANFAQHYPTFIQEMAQKHEIASHSFYHGNFMTAHLEQSKKVLENISGQNINGLRMPRFLPVKIEAIKEAGYKYDSSINPTFIPGRYNNLKLPRTLYRENDFARLPVSVTPFFRVPLFWLAFKNLPYNVYRKMALRALRKDGYLSLYFHPWEFTDINSWKIPGYLKKGCSGALSEKLQRLIKDLNNEGEFETISSFLQDHTTFHE